MQNEGDEGFVYFFRNSSFKDEDCYKIGFSEDWRKRLKQLNTSTPDDFEPVLILQHPEYPRVEKMIHEQFEHKLYNREFYYLDSDDFSKITKKYNEYVLYVNYDFDNPVKKSSRKVDFSSFSEIVRNIFSYPGEKIPHSILKRELCKLGYNIHEVDFLLKREDMEGNLMYIKTNDEFMRL